MGVSAMKSYIDIQVTKKQLDMVVCNRCGRELEKYEDHLSVSKKWGYGTGFDGETHVGELVCNRAVAEDLLEVFRILYEKGYPIERIRLIDEYEADDERSMADNNSSAFCFRRVAGKEELSNHSTGRAVDINPLYNPYITERGFTPLNGGDYVDRSRDFPHKIDENDLCYRLLTELGFEWGGHWSHAKDYQHFQRLEEK
jgi:hypothetical protein